MVNAVKFYCWEGGRKNVDYGSLMGLEEFELTLGLPIGRGNSETILHRLVFESAAFQTCHTINTDESIVGRTLKSPSRASIYGLLTEKQKSRLIFNS